MVITYEYGFAGDVGECQFAVDFDKFTESIAKELMGFWYNRIIGTDETWVDFALRYLALQCIALSVQNNVNTYGVKSMIEDEYIEGISIRHLNGDLGVELLNVGGMEFSLSEVSKVP